jgi:ABC-2 type transport system ATP-binding protein
MMDSPAIDLRQVTKTYGRKVQALRGVQMRVSPGEIFGLLGPNGAGKSTLVKIMMTIVRPTRAEGTLLGRPLGHKATLRRVGYLPEHHRMPPYLTGRQALEFFAALGRVDRPARKRRAAELLELVGMQRWADTRLGTYSKGMQQRIALAQTLMNDPELVVLDEPTDGLYPVGRKETRDILQQLRAQGKTVFLNSHLLGEVERLCDRVAILVGGTIVRQGTIVDLTAGSTRYIIELGGDDRSAMQAAIRAALPCRMVPALETLEAVGAAPRTMEAAETGTLPSGEIVELSGTTLRVATGDPLRIQPLLDALRGQGLVIQVVRPVRQSLEDYFMQAVSGSSETGAASIVGEPT